jgi:hypothetical protein
VAEAHFEVNIRESSEGTPPGFLFLCPRENFEIGPSSFGWPDCAAFWSLHPSGVDRLTLQPATDLECPSFRLTTTLRGYSWDASVYEGLRQVQRGKGFDPDTQDLALHLDSPIYRLASEDNSLFAHGKWILCNIPFFSSE